MGEKNHQHHPGFRKALVVFNPTAGRGRQRRLESVINGLGRMGCRYELFRTILGGDAEKAAQRAAGQDFDLIVAAGGDGTVNEVVNGLASVKSHLPVAFLPLGTANVLAAEIGLSTKPQAFLRMLASPHLRTIRLGLVGGRHFLLMASAGLDATVVRGVDLTLKRRTGQMAYAIEAIRQTLSYDFPEFNLTIDGGRYSARMAVICRARCYGGPFQLAPRANLGDPNFQVVLLPDSGKSAALRYGIGLITGRLPVMEGVQIVAGSDIEIDGPLGAPLQADGDLIGTLPAKITIAEPTICLVTP